MTCEQHRLALAADPDERTGELLEHLDRCEECAAFARDAASLAGLARAMPRPDLPVVEHAPAVPSRRWVLLAAAALAALLALWILYPAPPRQVAPAPKIALAEGDAAVSPAAGDVDLYAAMSRARAVWAGGAVASWSRVGDPVEGLNPMSDIFSSGLLAEAIGDTSETEGY